MHGFEIDELVARLASWKGGALWFTERIVTEGSPSFAQQSFKLTRAAWEGEFVHVQGRWGHDLSLRASTISAIEMDDRRVRVTERLGPGVDRVSQFALVALKNESRTNIGDAAHVTVSDSASVPSVGGVTGLCLTLDRRPFLFGPAPAVSRTLPKALRSWSDRPIVFWIGATVREQLAFWRACELIVSAKLKPTAWFCGPSHDELKLDSQIGLGVLAPEHLALMFGRAHPLPAQAIQFLASRWRAVLSGERPANRFGAGLHHTAGRCAFPLTSTRPSRGGAAE